MKKSANQRLKDIGMLPENLQYEGPISKDEKKNYYASDGAQDYLIGEAEVKYNENQAQE